MNIGLVQMQVSNNRNENIELARLEIRKLAKTGAKLIVLPEMFICPYDITLFRQYAESEGGEAYKMMQDVAKECGVYVVGGSIPEIFDQKIFNTSYVFDSDGMCIAKHRKKHLFDIDIPNGITFKESEVLSPGDTLTVVETPFGRLGIMICFDIRFIEDAAVMKAKKVDYLIVPGAFNQVTGPLHWQLLFQSRANDLQCVTVGVAPARSDEGYQSYGHSLVCSPWGKVLYQAGYGVESTSVNVNEEDYRSVREGIPIN